MIIKNDKIQFKNYLPLFFLICLSGNPIITSENYSKTLLVVYTFLFSFYTLSKIRWRIKYSIINHLAFIISFIAVLVIAQRISLGFVSYPGVFALILKIFLGLVTLLYYKNINVLNIYVKIMVFLSIISIPFFILNQIGYYGISINNGFKKSFIFYTSTTYSPYLRTPFVLIRNSGMFWEPGAFSGYLNLAIIFIILLNKEFKVRSYKKEIFWISLGVLTSMSTAGYIIFGIFISLYVLTNYKWGKIVLAPIFFIIIYFSYTNLSFLYEKVDEQYYSAQNYQPGDFTNTRFGSLLWDYEYIKSQPIFGNGLDINTRFRFDYDVVNADVGNGNGFSNFIVYWGIPFFLFWLYNVYKFSYNISEKRLISLITIFIMILSLQGEQFLNFPLFLTFFVFPVIYKNRKELVSNKRIISERL